MENINCNYYEKRDNMQILPSYIIIDFFEWVRVRNSSRVNIGFVRECVWRKKYADGALNRLLPIVEEFINEKNLRIEPYEFVDSLEHYLKSTEEKIESSLWKERDLTANDYYLSDLSLSCMIWSDDSANEIEFLEWLIKKHGDVNFSDMSKSNWRKIFEKYSIYRRGYVDKNVVSTLMKTFEFDGIYRTINRLKEIAKKEPKVYRKLTDIFIRYSNPKIFKCLFLPVSIDNHFETFIHNYWTNINDLTKDFLDVYYSEKELVTSGYAIKDKFEHLDIPEDVIPCLLIWKESIRDAKYVEIRELDDAEVFHVIQRIVQNIKTGRNLDFICKEAIKMADKYRENHKPSTTIHVEQKAETVIGSMTGVVMEKARVNTKVSYVENNRTFVEEIDMVVRELKKIEDINESQKDYLVSILNEVKIADDDVKKQNCKEKFSAFMKGLGDVSGKVLSVLANFATVAAFFE